MPRYVKLDKIESSPTDNAVEDITKPLPDWVRKAYKKAIKEQCEHFIAELKKKYTKGEVSDEPAD